MPALADRIQLTDDSVVNGKLLAAERAEDNGVTTTDRQFGGVDYSSFFSPDNGW